MAGSKFRSDRGLTSRMILTMVLLFVVYVLFIVGLVAAGLNIWLVLVLVGAFALFSYLSSDKIAMLSIGARVYSPKQEPVLTACLVTVCSISVIANPLVGIVHDHVMQA